MKALKFIVLSVLVLAMIGGGYAGYRHLSKPNIFKVRQVPLTRVDLRSSLSAVGTLSSRDELTLAAPVSSTVVSLPVDIGARVSNGQTIAVFDEQDFNDRYLAAQASSREAASELRAARRDLRSLRPVVAAGGEPDQSLRDAETAVSLARARQARATAQASALKAEQRKYQLNAPVPGVVTRLDVRQGQFVSVGTPLLSLAPTDDLMIRARIDQSVSTALSPGTMIDVTSESQPGITLTLKIDRIDPSLEREGTSSYVVAWIKYDPQSELKLRLNQQVDLNVVTETRENTIALPLEGLISRDGKEFVRILDDGLIRTQAVTSGIQDGALIEITKGLTGDETVVVTRARNVSDGAQATLTNQVDGQIRDRTKPAR